ncbi:MAG: T9SS type A sorting domain-containing protein [Bacteroidales bacterium]|nr:T9SS type A sorting domain-containing protein [Bacteroidales bacterium]
MKKNLISFIVACISILILISNNTAKAGDHLSDSLALVALYDSTNGSSWTINTGWKTDTLGAWYGIKLKNGRVVEIGLNENNLNGTIPKQIGGLDSLERLILNHNYNISGSIPAEIGNLSKLLFLRLNSNKLTGNIPPELGNLVNILQVYLGNNELTGSIPDELGNLVNAYDLYLSSNSLTGSIPTSLSNMATLQLLYLGYNDLSGGIPVELVNLSNLRFLDLSGNPLGDTIPSQLGNMSNLWNLHLGACNLIGSIPVALTNMTSLQTLDLYGNQLTGTIPAELGNMSNLYRVNFYANQLSGEIPPELGNLSNLQQLSLSANNFTGSIPPELGNLTNLQYVELYSNQLTGAIPPELGNLTNAFGFFVSGNQLTGSIPSELGNLTKLISFQVQDNHLTGSVPQELTSLTNLGNIFLNDNQFDKLPDFSNLSNLTTFVVNDNKFTFGDLEPNIHKLTSYSPQDSIGAFDTLYFAIGDTLFMTVETDGLYNKYQWTQNGVDISDNGIFSGTNDSVLKIISPNSSNTGVYICKVTNDTVTGLTIYTNPIEAIPTVKISSLPSTVQCADDSITIGYRSVNVNAGNVFTVELSDSLGGFDTPMTIGIKTTNDSIGSIRAYIPDSVSTGNQYLVRVNASNPALTGITSIGALSILNRTLSAPVVLPSSDSSICEGSSLSLFTGIIPDVYYLWYQDDVAITVATFSEYSTDAAGSYYVKIYDMCSPDSLSSNVVNVTVEALPTITLTMAGAVLTATQDANYIYTWYKDGDELPVAATEHQYTATENGVYSVEVTDENGCSEMSNSQSVTTIVDVDDPLSVLEIFPNPTNGKINIALKNTPQIERITISNLAGKKVYDQSFTEKQLINDLEIDISDQKSGMYIIHVTTDNKPLLLKLIKL